MDSYFWLTIWIDVEKSSKVCSGLLINYYEGTPVCVTSMKEELHKEPLEKRQLRSQPIMMYKISNDLIDIPATSYLTPGDNRTRGSKYRQLKICWDILKFFFFLRTIRDWNRLPDHVHSGLQEAANFGSWKPATQVALDKATLCGKCYNHNMIG